MAEAMAWRSMNEASFSAFSIQFPPPTTLLDAAVLLLFALVRVERADFVPVLKEKSVIQPFSMTAKHSFQFLSLPFLSRETNWILCFSIPSFAQGAPANSSASSSSNGA